MPLVLPVYASNSQRASSGEDIYDVYRRFEEPRFIAPAAVTLVRLNKLFEVYCPKRTLIVYRTLASHRIVPFLPRVNAKPNKRTSFIPERL